jgi:hypothetical protein
LGYENLCGCDGEYTGRRLTSNVLKSKLFNVLFVHQQEATLQDLTLGYENLCGCDEEYTGRRLTSNYFNR